MNSAYDPLFICIFFSTVSRGSVICDDVSFNHRSMLS